MADENFVREQREQHWYDHMTEDSDQLTEHHAVRLMEQGEFEWGTVTELGIDLKVDTPEKEWLRITESVCDYWQRTGKEHARAAFMMADLLAHGDEHFHENYAQAIDATREFIRLHTGVLMRYQRIARQVPAQRRRIVLSLAHHEEVGPLSPDLQEKYLQLAIDEAMTVKELRARIRAENPKKKQSGKKKEPEEDDEETAATALQKMIDASNWCSANFDQITAKMEGPIKKFYAIYRRKWIARGRK